MLMIHRNAAVRNPRTSATRQPVTVRWAHPLAMALAREIAGGDIRRVHPQPDGSVIVSNSPAKQLTKDVT